MERKHLLTKFQQRSVGLSFIGDGDDICKPTSIGDLQHLFILLTSTLSIVRRYNRIRIEMQRIKNSIISIPSFNNESKGRFRVQPF